MARTNANPDPEKQLMIKTKACQRLAKEAAYYKKEERENEAQLATMRAENKDPHDIKKFEEVLAESTMMIPDSEARLAKNLTELATFLDANGADIDTDGEWAKAARDLLVKNNIAYKGEAAEQVAASTSGDVEETATNVDDLKEGEAF